MQIKILKTEATRLIVEIMGANRQSDTIRIGINASVNENNIDVLNLPSSSTILNAIPSILGSKNSKRFTKTYCPKIKRAMESKIAVMNIVLEYFILRAANIRAFTLPTLRFSIYMTILSSISPVFCRSIFQ